MSDTATLDSAPAAIAPAGLIDLPAEVRRAIGAQVHKRATQCDRASADAEARTVELAFASAAPYQRYWGTEVLDMRQSAVNLSRLNARHPLLLNHDPAQQIGVIERAWVDSDGKARAMVRFSRSALGEEIWQDVQDGIRELVSVGYQIDDMVLQSRDGDNATYLVTRWTPHEVSIVSVPADPTVGVGRSLAAEAPNAQIKEIPTMSDTTATPAATQPDIRVIETSAIKMERERQTEIRAIAAAHHLQAEAADALDKGTSVDAFRKIAMDKLVERGAIKPAAATADIGMTKAEVRRFSVARLMLAVLDPGSRDAQRAAAFELECSEAARKLRPIDDKEQTWGGHRASGVTVPLDVLGAPVATDAAAAEYVATCLRMSDRTQRRDLTVGTSNAGGYLVATDLLAGSFIDLLRNRLVLSGLGATMLDGLVGNVAIPSQTAGASTYWVAEGTAVTESQLVLGQVTLTPKTVGMFTDYSRKTLLQATPAIEALVRADLAAGLAVEIDRAGINGSGSSGQPTGVIATSGIGAVAGGTNGAAPTYAHMIALEEQIAIANADIGNMAFLTNAKMRAQLRGTQVFSSTNGAPVWASDNTVMGYTAAVTNSVPSTLTKGSASGVCSAILLGNWADLLIGMWGGLDLLVDPYALATAGGRRVVALQDVDVAVRRVGSFAAMLDALRT